MAIDDFWRNVRTAASLFTASTTDSPHGDAAATERKLRGASGWLTPQSIAAFSPEDFGFLEEDQRTALQQSVERFRASASQVQANKPVTREQAEEGGAALREILGVLQPHRFGDAESFRTQTLLERELRGKLPRWVTGLSCETGLDVSEEPAVWIWVDVTDRATDRRMIAKHGQVIEEAITAAYRGIGGRRWPFVRFRNPSELNEGRGLSA